MIGYRRRGVEKGKPVGEHVGAASLVGVVVGQLEFAEGDSLLGEGVVVLLAGGDSLVHLSFVGSSMVAEGGGGEASLFLRHDLKRQGAFFFFGHGHIAFVIVVKETLKNPSARASP